MMQYTLMIMQSVRYGFLKKALALVFFILCAGPLSALNLKISQGHVAPIPIALTPAREADAALTEIGRDIIQKIEMNLKFSGGFSFIDERAYVQDMRNLHENGPRFGDWRILNAHALTRLSLKRIPEGILLTFHLYDVMTQKELVGLSIKGRTDQWRRMAHKVSDSIYKSLTGDEGYFDTQIAYVHETGSRVHRRRQIAIMDQDGHNHRFLTPKTQNIVLSPRFSPSGQRLVYLDFGKNNRVPRVRIMDIKTQKNQTLGEFPGMTFAPRFSPNGQKVMMSLARNGSSALYEMDLVSRSVKSITSGPFLDTSPCYSPDGERVVFNTNRSGTQQIYLMDANGDNMRRISYGPGRYATPVWSPRGDWIAFTKMSGGQFYIGVMRPDGSGERLITTHNVVEDPSWSANGRMIIFSRTDPRIHGKSTLNAVDITGFHERLINIPAEGSGPTWSGTGGKH